MVKRSYTPDAGDVVWVDLDPARGHEQAKVRPALVVSPKSYNAKTGLLLACPITSVEKGYPFEVSIVGKKVDGVVLADHIRSLDWGVRNARFIFKAKPQVISDVRAKLALLVGVR